MTSLTQFYNELIDLLTMLKPYITSKTNQFIFTELKTNINLLRQINYEPLLKKLINSCHKHNITQNSSYDEILRSIILLTTQHNFTDEHRYYSSEINREYVENLIHQINESIFQRKIIYAKLLDILKIVFAYEVK